MPTIGYTLTGAEQAVTDYQHQIYYSGKVLTGAGIITGAKVWAKVIFGAGTHQVRIHCYTWNASLSSSLLVASSGVINISNTVSVWLDLPMSGTLIAGTEYICDVQSYDSATFDLRVGQTFLGGTKTLGDTDLIAPANLAGAGNSGFARSGYIDYVVSGGVRNEDHRRGYRPTS